MLNVSLCIFIYFLKKFIVIFSILISRCLLLVESEAIDFCIFIFTKLSYLLTSVSLESLGFFQVIQTYHKRDHSICFSQY